MKHTKFIKFSMTSHKIPDCLPDSTFYKVYGNFVTHKKTTTHLTRYLQVNPDQPHVTSLEHEGTNRRRNKTDHSSYRMILSFWPFIPTSFEKVNKEPFGKFDRNLTRTCRTFFLKFLILKHKINCFIKLTMMTVGLFIRFTHNEDKISIVCTQNL